MENKKTEYHYTIFEPGDEKDYRSKFPEFQKIPEFMSLPLSADLKFAWYYANPTSLIAKIQEPEIRAMKAIEAAYDGKIKDSKYKDLVDGKFTPELDAAIKRMKSFVPSARIRAKIIQDTMFQNLEAMVNIRPEDLISISTDEKKKYADFAKSVSSQLQELISSVESSYGVEIKEKRESVLTKEGWTLVDQVLLRRETKEE